MRSEFVTADPLKYPFGTLSALLVLVEVIKVKERAQSDLADNFEVCLLQGSIALELTTEVMGEELTLRVHNAVKFLHKLDLTLLAADRLTHGRF